MDKRYKNIDINYAFELMKKNGVAKTAEILGIHRKTLREKFKKDGIKTINRYSIAKFNDNYFKSIDTEDKAYWLGFIFADGCVNKKRASRITSIQLSIIDKEHLHKFNKCLECPDKKIFLDKRKCCAVKYTSKKLYLDLISHGCVERKSLVLDWPINVPDNLIRHFIRGYFDGDGSIFKLNNKTGWGVCIIGSSIFINKLKDHLEKMGMSKRKVRRYKNPKTLSISYSSKHDVNFFLDYLYKETSVYLNRKYKLYLDSEKDRYSNTKARIDIELALEYLKSSRLPIVSKIFGVSTRTLTKRIDDNGFKKEYKEILKNKQRSLK